MFIRLQGLDGCWFWQNTDKIARLWESHSGSKTAYISDGSNPVKDILGDGYTIGLKLNGPANPSVYADWLEEHGEPEAANKLRKEFVNG